VLLPPPSPRAARGQDSAESDRTWGFGPYTAAGRRSSSNDYRVHLPAVALLRPCGPTAAKPVASAIIIQDRRCWHELGRTAVVVGGSAASDRSAEQTPAMAVT
jgi:hypothetical protein